jgi:hypothetical protein
MATDSNPDLIECPRCGSPWCESNRFGLLCPSCLYIEEDPAQNRGRPSAAPSVAAASDSEDGEATLTLGELIESIPSDFTNWEISLNEERFLKMNAVQKQEQQEKSVTVFDVMIAEEGKNGRTYWQNIGVAFPLTNGSKGLSLKLHMFPGLRVFVMESIRPVGAAKHNRENDPVEETPF